MTPLPAANAPGRLCKNLHLPCTLVLAMLLQACSVLGSRNQVHLQIYALDSAANPIQQVSPALAIALIDPNAAEQAVILVNSPSAAPGYDSARMVYVRKPDTLEAFTQSAWVDTPARMLAPLLVHSLERSGQFRAVVQAPSSAKVQLRLDTTIVRLQQNFLQSPSQLRFSVHATLIDNNSREVLAWRAFDVIEETSSDDASGGAAATRTAVQVALQALVRWLEPLSRQPGAID